MKHKVNGGQRNKGGNHDGILISNFKLNIDVQLKLYQYSISFIGTVRHGICAFEMLNDDSLLINLSEEEDYLN